MTPRIDGLWTMHYQGVNGMEAGGVTTFIDRSLFGGDSGQVFTGAVDLQERSVGAYFKVQNVIPHIPNAFGRKYIEFHLRGQLEDSGDRISAEIKSSLVPAMIVIPVEFRKKADFLNGQTPLVAGQSSIPVLHTVRGHEEKFGGFWTIEVETRLGTGTGVLLLAQGAAVGGNSNYTFVGTTQTEEDNIKIRLVVTTFRAGGANLFGYFGNCEVDFVGSIQRRSTGVGRPEIEDVENHSQIHGNAVVVHLPEVTGHCRLKRKIRLPHHPQL